MHNNALRKRTYKIAFLSFGLNVLRITIDLCSFVMRDLIFQNEYQLIPQHCQILCTMEVHKLPTSLILYFEENHRSTDFEHITSLDMSKSRTQSKITSNVHILKRSCQLTTLNTVVRDLPT